MSSLDPTLVAGLVLLAGVGAGMVRLGLDFSMLEVRPARRRCRSCGAQLRDQVCSCRSFE
jgi:hypothetical protein